MATPPTAAVALNRPFREPFTYLVPEELVGQLEPGMLVEVPLSSQEVIGCVVELDPPDITTGTLKLQSIRRRVSPDYQLTGELLRLARWMADYYFCGIGEALSTMSMVGFGDVALGGSPRYQVAKGWNADALTPRQREVARRLQALPAQEPTSISSLATDVGTTPATMKKLAQAGVLEEVSVEDTPPPRSPPPDVPPTLSDEQQAAFDAVAGALDGGEFGVFLLHGITGSGKTEVYLRLIERAFAAGKSAICLVPEISLTPQTVERFTCRFQEEIGVFHSQLTRREKLVLHRKIQKGRIRLVIGARSATFAPLPKLGLVVIDEEHEGSYKQGEIPRYHARDLAIYRASLLKIPVLMGSATPSVESFENARRGKFHLLRLTRRPMGLNLPEVRLIPMGQAAVEDPSANTLLSRDLREAIAKRLERGEQSLLFLNRRGFSNFLMCPHCKWVARCDDDDIVMTIHRKRKKGEPAMTSSEEELDLFPRPLARDESFLKCHFCGRTSDYPAKCPKCGNEGLTGMGTGTQRIEEALARNFPDARVLRLDQDAIGGRRAFLEAWQSMVSGEAQIILGTQMIAKGLHLERVTLVGVILADVGLFIPDFRAEERTFSLLMQVAGRAGRTEMGEVLVQTYLPHHPAIQLAAKHDYEGFFKVEMVRREKLRFPPVQRLVALTFSDPDGEKARRSARQFRELLDKACHRYDCRGIRLLGPGPAPVRRLAGRFRERLLLRGPVYGDNAKVLRAALGSELWKPPASMRLSIDVDPVDLL
jgi:primosomal protein N' (replication factor Y) (superfamily II helicase)